MKLKISAMLECRAMGWFVLAALVFGYQFIVFVRDRANSAGAQRQLGPGTWLSLARLISLSMLAGFLAIPRPSGTLAWIPFLLALFFNVSDLFDGYLARRFGGTGRLGAKLDLDLDARGMLIGSILVVKYGQVGWWFVLAGAARYVFVFVGWLREKISGKKLGKMPPNALRRPFAGMEMGICTALLAPVLAPAATNFVATLSLFPFLGNFLFDWLAMAGWVKTNVKISNIGSTIVRSLGLLLRLLLGTLLIWQALAMNDLSSSILMFLFAALLILGIATRLVALFSFALICLTFQPVSIYYALLFGLTTLAYLGPGYFALWQPEGGLLEKRLGEDATK